MSQIIHSIKWNFIGNLLVQILKFVITLFLARILIPEDFGLLALSLSFLALGKLFSDFGLGQSLIQKKHIDENDITFIFFLQISLGITLSIVVYITSGFIANFFNNIRLESILNTLSSIFIIQSLGLVSLSLMKRNFEFKKIQTIEIFSYFISYAFVAIPLAINNFGIWSLVWAQILQPSIQSISYIYIHPIKVVLTLKFDEHKSLLRFSSKNFINNILSWSIDNVSVFFIGYVLNANLLGYFNRYLTLLKMPMDIITSSFQSVLFSTFSKKQDDIIELKRKQYLLSITIISFVIFPIFSVVSVVPETIIGSTLGNNWLEFTNIIFILSICMILNTLLAIPGPILWGNNIGEKEIRSQFMALVLTIISYFLFFIEYEPNLFEICLLILFTYIIRLIFINNALFKYLNCTWLDFFNAILRPAIVSIILMIITNYFDSYIYSVFHNYYINLLLDIFINILIIFLLIVFKFDLFLTDNIKEFLLNYEEKIPERIKKNIRRNKCRKI